MYGMVTKYTQTDKTITKHNKLLGINIIKYKERKDNDINILQLQIG